MVLGFFKRALRSKPLVLHVDDEPDLLTLVAAALKAAGADVVSCDNAAAAIALARKQQPDLILLDILMPMTDGFQVCAKLKSDPQTREIPVVMVTALGQMKDIEKALGNGAAGYLMKPFDVPKLYAKVREFVPLPEKKK